MARQRTQYKLVGRYLRGNDTIYYGLITSDGKEVRATEEVMAYYVGREQVINVSAQLYKDKMLFRGIDCDIRNLPTIQLGSTGGKDNVPPKPVPPKPVQPKPVPPKPVQPKPVPPKPVQPKPVPPKPVPPKPVPPKPVPPKPVPPKPVQQRPVQKHKLSDRIVNDISEYTNTKIQSNYEDAVATLLGKYSSLAYELEKTLYFKDMIELGCKVHLYKSDRDVHYILVNIWESNDYKQLAVSTTTLQLLQYEYPELVTKFNGDDTIVGDLKQYKYCHYHELVIRLGMFSRIPQYKKLKMQFVRYNKEIFDNKITPKMVMVVGEYKDGTKFDDLEDCTGYSRRAVDIINNYPLIIVKYSCFRSINYIDNLSRSNLCTLLHEMGHAYVNEIYGTNWETNPNDMGDVLYGIDKSKHPVQYKAHGRKFGNTVEMISEKTGFSFDEIFSYGVKINNSKKNTKYTRNLGHGAVEYSTGTDMAYTDEYYNRKNKINGRVLYNEKFAEIKETLSNNKDFFKGYFKDKFNIELNIITTDDDMRISTVDRFGNIRDYDINFYCDGRARLLLYRLINNTNYMLYQATVGTSDVKAIIKRTLEAVYKDTINN